MSERATVEVKVSAEVNTILRDLFNQIQYELCEQYEDEIERLNQNNQSYQEEMARTWKIADDYKSRCEKAIEYIEKEDWNTYYDKKLLNILKGSDEK